MVLIETLAKSILDKNRHELNVIDWGIEKSGGKVHATEYWGFRSLAYPLAKRAKAHYVCLGMEASSLEALNHYLKFHKDLLRFLFIKKPKGLEFPTLLLHSSLADLAIEEEEVQTKGDVA